MCKNVLKLSLFYHIVCPKKWTFWKFKQNFRKTIFPVICMFHLSYLYRRVIEGWSICKAWKKLCTKNATASPAKRDGKNDALLQTRQKFHCCQTIIDSKSIHDTPLLVLIYSPKSVHTYSFFLKLIIFVLPSRHFLISGHTTFAFHSCRETRTAVSRKGTAVCALSAQNNSPAVLASSRGCFGCYVWLSLQARYASMHICGFFRNSCTASGNSSIVQV